jgi:hypothetical protein
MLAPAGTARGAAVASGIYAGISISAPTATAIATDPRGFAVGTPASITLTAPEGGPDPVGQSFAAEIDITPQRWYVRRGKRLHIFDRAEDADAFIDAEAQAQKAVEQAQKTSRRARKRVRASIAMPQPVQTVDIDALSSLLRDLNMRVDLPALVAQQDFDRVMEVMARAVKAQADQDDELDIEMLLLA